MFREFYHVPIYIACIAAGAGGAWYLTTAAPQPPVHTVSWFRAHLAEAKKKNAECDNNPGVAMHDPECINADQVRGDNDRRLILIAVAIYAAKQGAYGLCCLMLVAAVCAFNLVRLPR